MDKDYYCLDSYLHASANAVVEGTLSHIDSKPNSSYLYLENVSLQLEHHSNVFSFSDFLVLASKEAKSRYISGNTLQIKGEILDFQTPTVPGQFNEKAYYKEMNIYYKMQAKSILLRNDTTSQPGKFLYSLRQKLANVYHSCMEEEKAGILSAMLLGEKSLLDTDLKSLYQINGIGHILAISGLHITILCTLVYQLTFLMHFPKPLPFGITVLFLFGYGYMTGFGISTSRAVIMMFLGLHAKEIGRSYEPFTAMAFSAICILLQKPYALFSCSFLLSYGAVGGICLVYPVCKTVLFGSKEKQMARKRRYARKQKEILANINPNHLIFEKLLQYFLTFPQKLIDSLLMNVSVWIATLPITLYFFYEIPTYGILLNLFVLPLVSVIIAFAFLGGVIGLCYLPLADSILFVAEIILAFYELLCNLFLNLPQPVQILGCPAFWQIILYYLLLGLICFFVTLQKPFYTAMLGLAAVFLLLYRPLPDGFKLSMLDVGQGDGIFLQTEEGKTMLIDGGSTSVSQVGKYRILPYLKYYGIRKVDYLLMTHPDEDHISGQQELIESYHTNGIRIGSYLVPKLSEETKNSNYQKIIICAKKAGIPVYYINTDDTLSLDNLTLTCLHPDRNFTGSSTNSYSVTLSLSYQDFSMLLTGDLETRGEEAVLQRLQKEHDISSYTVLKVAHHGSKNSTSAKFLECLKPKVALISCGEKNRYGHPHTETLKRLTNAGCDFFTTSEYGTITIEYEHNFHLKSNIRKNLLKFM